MSNVFEEISAQIAAQIAAKGARPQVKDLERSFIEILLHIAAVVLLIAYWYAAINAYRSGRSGDTKILFATWSPYRQSLSRQCWFTAGTGGSALRSGGRCSLKS